MESRLGCDHGVAHVEMLPATAERRRQHVTVEIDRPVADEPQVVDARLLARLTQRGGGERRITGLAVAADLRPETTLPMNVNSTCDPLGSSTSALAVRWAGTQSRVTPSGLAAKEVEVRRPQLILVVAVGVEGAQHSHRVGV